MKAIICEKYGTPEVLKLKEVLKPIPKDNEMLIKVKASAVTASDCIIRKFEIPVKNRFPMGYFMEFMMGMTLGFKKPKKPILGLIQSGIVQETGKNIKKFVPGDEVFAFTGFSFGSYAEYSCLKETESKSGCIGIKPENMSHEEAAAVVYGGVIALHFLPTEQLKEGKKVLVYGASGAIGTAAVQIAKSLGADVTGVCSTTNLEMVRTLGADKMIDYTNENAAKNLEKYDFILDAVGKIKSSNLKIELKKALVEDGKYVSVDDPGLKLKTEYINQLREMVEAGQIKAVIDKTYPLENIVEAHRYVDQKHKKGNVVISL